MSAAGSRLLAGTHWKWFFTLVSNSDCWDAAATGIQAYYDSFIEYSNYASSSSSSSFEGMFKKNLRENMVIYISQLPIQPQDQNLQRTQPKAQIKRRALP